MSRLLVLLVGLLLLPATNAEAKYSSVRICGPADCKEVTALGPGHQPADDYRSASAVMNAGFSAKSRLGAEPPEESAWYRVTLCSGDCKSSGEMAFNVLPTAGYVYLHPKDWKRVISRRYAPSQGWARMGDGEAPFFLALTADLEPYEDFRLFPLGAVEPSSALPVDPRSAGASGPGVPTLIWIAVAATAIGLSSMWLRHRVRSRSLR